MFERFTDGARRVVVLTQDEVRRRRSPHIGTGHLLLGLLLLDDALAAGTLQAHGVGLERARTALDEVEAGSPLGGRDADALKAIGIDLDRVRDRVEASFGRGALDRREPRRRRWFRRRREPGTGHVPFTPRAKTVLELSLREALALKHRYIGPEHILLGLLREGRGTGVTVLQACGGDPGSVRAEVLVRLDRAA